MQPQSKKAKGSRLERNWAELLRGYGLDKMARRMPLSGAFDTPSMKADIFTSLPIHFEVKNQENWSPLEYWKQANEMCGSRIPVVVMSRNREQIYCFLLGSDFLRILQNAMIGGLMGKPKIEKPSKPKKLSPEDTAWQPFSKQWQARKKKK
jgi:hypothetical protein